MPVYERAMAAGSWDLVLREDTPTGVLDRISVAFAHVVITPSWIPIPEGTSLTADTFLSAARYTGVMVRPPRQRTIGGHGLAWWLGDPDGDGDCLTTQLTLTASTFQAAVAALLPTSLSSGSVEAAGGSMTGKYRWLSRRDMLDAVCDFFGREWRVHPDFTLSAGTDTHLYGALPDVLLGPRAGSSDLTLDAVHGDVTPSVDWSRWRNEVWVLGRGGIGAWNAATSTLRDGRGNIIARTSVIADASSPAGGEESTAQTLVTDLGDTAGVSSVTVSTTHRDPMSVLTVGGDVLLYDPADGIQNTANPVTYRGEQIYPLRTRLWGCRWPVVEGMGVYIRVTTGAGPTVEWIDITNHVEFESPGAELEVGTRRVRPQGERFHQIQAGQDAWRHSQWEAYTPVWTTTGSPPSLGNGTLVGSYRLIGSEMHYRGRLTFGSTTTGGTGDWYITTPGVAANSGHASATMLDSGTRWWMGQAIHTAGDNRITFIAESANGVTATAPMTWATNDFLDWEGTVEVTLS